MLLFFGLLALNIFLNLLLSVRLSFNCCLMLMLLINEVVEDQVGWQGYLNFDILEEFESFVVKPWHNVVVQNLDFKLVGVEANVLEILKHTLSETSNIVL